MYRFCVAIFTCCALLEQCCAAPRSRSEDARSDHDALQEIQDQESILSQLLGDYDKVKALSEGSDCRCKCVVRPLSRSACRRIEEGHARAEDFYTVETITSGPECKCACVAPPSAVNPCEGEFRLKRLREAGKENVKLSTILELLEGSFYGMDLLKLHSVTNKLLERLDHIEKVVLVNQSKAEGAKPQLGPQLQADETESPPTDPLPQWTEEKMSRDEVSRSDVHLSSEDKLKEKVVTENRSVRRSSAQILETSPEKTHKDSVNHVTKPGSNGLIIRGMTFYKSEPDPMVADDGEPGENLFEYDGFSGDGPINLFIEENLLQHKTPRPRTRPSQRTFQSKTQRPFSSSRKITPSTKPKETDPHQESPTRVTEHRDEFTQIPTELTMTTKMPGKTNTGQRSQKDSSKPRQWPIDLTDEPHGAKTTTGQGQSPGEMATKDSTKAFTMRSTPPTMMETSDLELKDQAAGSAAADLSTQRPTIIASTMATASHTTPNFAALSTRASKDEIPTTLSTQLLTSLPLTTPGTSTASSAATAATSALSTTSAAESDPVETKQKMNWEEKTKEEKPNRRKPGDCKDTLATISDPVTHNTYGKSEGAWMKDPKSDSGKIYVTNYFYGNDLLEFSNLKVFKQGHFTNSYKLPYNWIGTGHVVYGGAFYYNRAFSRDIIKYDLHHRYVAAWTMLHDAALEESSSPWEWRSYSDISVAVDESGLWIVYPALDDEGFLQEVVVLSRLNPEDLSSQRETTWRTGLRRSQYGNCFIVCGVLYFVDSHDRREANLEYAFDTHTNTQMIPRMPFTNNYTYTTQIDYNPAEGVLYAWDNGHQVTYNITFAYVEP